jgi:hypothetical protein
MYSVGKSIQHADDDEANGKGLTNCALSKIASTTPAMNELQLSCDNSRGTEIYFVSTGSLSEIMTRGKHE